MKDLFDIIIAWGSDKFVSLEYEPLPQIGFLLEELHEVNKEFIKGDIEAAVGGICDIVVYSVNALVLLDKDQISLLDFEFSKLSLLDNLSIIKIMARQIYYVINLAGFINSNGLSCEYRELIEYCVDIIKILGYTPELALLETVKKIESREGSFNPDSGKWEKTKTNYAPDYSKARLK